MATKVKGGAIKEGSIPLSALSEEIKNKIENAGGGATPDWNAQKGEVGYIKNKPFGIMTQANQSIEIEDNINYEDATGIIKFKTYYDFKILQQCNLGTSTTIYNDCSESNYIILWNSDYVSPEEYLRFKRKYEDGGEFIHEYEIGNTYESDDMLREEISEALKTLTYVYDDGTEGFAKIPQSMVNMPYIDPVVWKYICNPCIIKYGEKVPEELIGEYSDDVGSSGGYYLKYPNLAMYKIIFTNNRIDSEYGEASVIITPSGISEYGVELTDIHISKDYGVYTGDAHINKNKNWASV